MKHGWKLFFLTLLIVSIAVQGYSIYAYVKAENEWKSGGWSYMVHPLDYIANDCWNLTDPDQYILEAIQNPDEWTEWFDRRDSSFFSTAPWYEHLSANASERRPNPFLYNDTCYDYNCAPLMDIIYYPFPSSPKPEHTTIGLAVVWGAVGSVYFLKNRKTRT